MSIYKISRELVTYRNRLARLAKNNGQGDIQLANEEVASLIELLSATTEADIHAYFHEFSALQRGEAEVHAGDLKVGSPERYHSS